MTADTFASFDFGLSSDDEDRAARLHRDSIVVDALFQGPCGWRSYSDELVKELQADPANADARVAWGNAAQLPGRLAVDGRFPDYEACWRGSGITVAATGIGISTAGAVAAAAAMVATRTEALPWLTKAINGKDIRAAKAAGRHAMFLNCQPVEPVSRDLGLLNAAIDIGLRMLMLTYNNQDHIGAGCTERTNAGVSTFGVEVIRVLNERGVIVDTAHCGKQTTLDACQFSEAPVVASHSSAEAVNFHARAKSDEELEAIAATGGVIGVVTVPFFLGAGHPTIEVFLDHVEHIGRTVGWEHVGIGTDWPLQLPTWVAQRVGEAALKMGFRPEDGISGDNLVGFDDYRDMPNITRGLVARGCTDEQIAGVLGGNFLRVIDAVCG